jgi:hypothetical protein
MQLLIGMSTSRYLPPTRHGPAWPGPWSGGDSGCRPSAMMTATIFGGPGKGTAEVTAESYGGQAGRASTRCRSRARDCDCSVRRHLGICSLGYTTRRSYEKPPNEPSPNDAGLDVASYAGCGTWGVQSQRPTAA